MDAIKIPDGDDRSYKAAWNGRDAPDNIQRCSLPPLLLQGTGSLLCKIGEYHVCPGPFYRCKDLHHHTTLVDPSKTAGSLDHGILSAHIVGGDRQIPPLFRSEEHTSELQSQS